MVSISFIPSLVLSITAAMTNPPKDQKKKRTNIESLMVVILNFTHQDYDVTCITLYSLRFPCPLSPKMSLAKE